jgi:tetratricopeptide (TPR) repeat protein
MLEPLTHEEARELVSALALGSGAPAAMTAELAERSGGNPLFAEALVDVAGSGDPGHGGELPETVQGLLAARLDELEPAERQLLEHAAVVGLSVSESALEPVARAADADLGRSLQSLRRKNLVVLAAGHGRSGEAQLEFKHALIRDVTYEMLPLAARARKHAEVAAFIERREGAGDERVAPLLAEHYARAATLAARAHMSRQDVSRLRRLALDRGEAAGDAAAQLFSNQAAIDHYRAAEAFAQAGDPIALRVAEKRGDVELRLGHVDAALEAWERCLDFFGEMGDLPRCAAIHRKVAAAYTQSGQRDAAIEHLQRGIDLINDLPASPELVRLFEEAAVLNLEMGDNMWAVYAAERALRFAEQLGQPLLASRAHGVYGRVFGRVGDATKAREHLQRAVEIARTSSAAEVVLALLVSGRNREDCEGDYAGADALYEEALALAERVGEVPAQIDLRAARAELASYRCDWHAVGAASERIAALAGREGLVGRLCLTATLDGQLRWHEGELEASEQLFAEANEIAQRGGRFEVSIRALTGLAETLRDRGELVSAEGALLDALAVCERAGFVPRAVQVHAALALTRALAGRTEAAREAAAQALALSERVRDPVNETAAREARGVVAEPAEACEALRAAGASWEALGRRLDAARCTMLLGRRLGETEPDAGRRELARSAELFEQCGVPHLREQALELAREV